MLILLVNIQLHELMTEHLCESISNILLFMVLCRGQALKEHDCNMFQNNALYHPEPAFTSVRGKRKQRHLIVITMPKRHFFTKHIILKAFLYTMPLMNYSSIFTHTPELNLNKDHTNAKSSNSRHQKYCFELLDHCIRSK